MKITDLKTESAKGTMVKVWCECATANEVDDLIAWLRLAKSVMLGWERINAEASRKTQAAAAKHEAPQQGKVLSPPQIEGGEDGKHSSEADTGRLT